MPSWTPLRCSSPLCSTVDRIHLSYKLASPSSCIVTAQRRLCCPRVTTLSLGNLGGWYFGLELHVPSVRRFSYRVPPAFMLVSPPPASMVRAYLHFDLDFFLTGTCY
jgi:hypothetical protein